MEFINILLAALGGSVIGIAIAAFLGKKFISDLQWGQVLKNRFSRRIYHKNLLFKT